MCENIDGKESIGMEYRIVTSYSDLDCCIGSID